jgi:cation diffusion facilitator CzcD-associated flavoprotein CzcO
MLVDVKANDEAYNFWARKTRARINDPRKRDILAPLKPPHVFGAKRLSLEQDFYEQFNKPNIDVIDVRANPVDEIVPEGIRTADGVVHEFDVIALATGFDSITGGLKDIDIRGIDGTLLREKWDKGTWTYLGMTTASFPNFFFLYGPQGPTAFANGPSCVEPQADWLLEVLEYMQKEGKGKLDATVAAEQEWRQLVHDYSSKSLRHHVDSWYNGANIPGKPREPLNFAGGLPEYVRRLKEVRNSGMAGFQVS